MVSGSRQGSFHNFETGEKGGMIQLLISELGIDFKTALEKGHQMINGYNSYIEPVTTKKTTDLPKTGRIDSKKQAFIHSILNKSQPIEGSIAQEYLRSRGLDKIETKDLCTIKQLNTGSGNNEVTPSSSAHSHCQR